MLFFDDDDEPLAATPLAVAAERMRELRKLQGAPAARDGIDDDDDNDSAASIDTGKWRLRYRRAFERSSP